MQKYISLSKLVRHRQNISLFLKVTFLALQFFSVLCFNKTSAKIFIHFFLSNSSQVSGFYVNLYDTSLLFRPSNNKATKLDF